MRSSTTTGRSTSKLRSGRRGAARLRRVLEARHPDAHLARSELEARALESLESLPVPRPSVNVWLGELGVEVDLLWRGHGLAIELDGRRYHAHRRAADAAKDERLRAGGLEVRRYGWGDVLGGWMARELAARLTAGCSRACAAGPAGAWSAGSRGRR